MNPEIERMRRADSAATRFRAATGGMSLLRLVLPNDLKGHRERFLRDAERGAPDNPRFTYTEPDGKRAEDLRKVHADAVSRGDPWHQLIADEAERYLFGYRACASHDAVRITEATSRENGTPDADLLADALRILRTEKHDTPGQRRPELNSDDASAAIADVLGEEDLSDWTVLVKPDMAARMSVSMADRSVRIRADIRLSEDELVRLITHEIGTHVFRWKNAVAGANILGLQLSGHTATEEGLAVWNEQRVSDGDSLDRRFALRVVAVHTALEGSFTDVVRALVPYTPLGSAFDVAVRVKRGLTDTSVAGGFVKDHVYLSGYRMLQRHLNGHPGDHDLLMSSKWPLHRLDLLRDADLVAGLGDGIRRPDGAFVARVRARVRQRRKPPTADG
ncbi:tyrosine/phenylalanine carboxypeptidase domain-containing protein [Streptomyces sp. NPDC002018]|uniref:tyrosine/phenylalanine carboxypeptidase domain-containing protein n=1 Tax=Streptomyces sp. NPDC002018 TaxID=3364629 RepID=UPI0036744411